MYGLVINTAPAKAPLEIADVRHQCGIAAGVDTHDAMLQALIEAAKEYVERVTGRQLINATWDLILDHFPYSAAPLYLPKNPVSSVTSITYLDTDGASQTWSSANYRVATSKEPATVSLAYAASYPSTYAVESCVTVRFVAGYGTTVPSVPYAIRQAMLMLIAHWFENREAVGVVGGTVEMAVESLLANYTVGEEFACYHPPSYA